MSKQSTINVTEVLTHLINEIINVSPSFKNINISKILICIATNRNGRGGIYGKLLPLRFENGSRVLKHKGRLYSMAKISNNDIEQLYIVYFYMPKFFDLPAREKLRVIFHELYHISPEFNGDIRRMAKVKSAHGHSKKHFDLNFSNELESFYEYIIKTQYIKFLNLDSKSLNKFFSIIKGRRMKMPKPKILETV